jgi:putative sugar O-methyltransferase
MTQSSISDTSLYLSICEEAALQEEVFETFRQNPRYTAIVETPIKYDGFDYYDILLKHYPDFMKNADAFRRNDEVGGPVLVEYPQFGLFSPNTLRYVKCLADLTSLFGSLDGLSILEIGGGYGGQCRMVSSLFQPRLYTILDLAEPLLLTNRYLSHYELDNVDYVTLDELVPGDFDLIISNYALSEIGTVGQDVIIDRVLRRAARGYLTWNITPQIQDLLAEQGAVSVLGSMYVAEDIVAKVPGSRIWDMPMPLDDQEREHQIIVWGT